MSESHVTHVASYMQLDIVMESFMYSHSHSGWNLRKVKAPSSNVSFVFFFFNEERRSSLELWASQQHSKMSPQAPGLAVHIGTRNYCRCVTPGFNTYTLVVTRHFLTCHTSRSHMCNTTPSHTSHMSLVTPSCCVPRIIEWHVKNWSVATAV